MKELSHRHLNWFKNLIKKRIPTKKALFLITLPFVAFIELPIWIGILWFAFGVSGLGDAFVYQFLRKYQYLLRVNSSNVVGSALDSLIFPTLAFGALMPEIVIGQFLAKIVGGGLWSVLLRKWRSQTEEVA